MPENTGFNTGFDMQPAPEVPMKEQQTAARISLELRNEELKKSIAVNQEIMRISSEFQKELQSLIGRNNLKQYKATQEKSRKELREIHLKANATFEGESEIGNVRMKLIRDSKDALQKMKFDFDKVQQLRAKYGEELRKLVTESLDHPEEPNFLVPPEAVPKEIHNPWKVYGPPYPGWAWANWWGKSDEPNYPIFYRYLNSAAGQVGTYTSIRVHGADDSDWAYVRYRTAVRFWYRLPEAGMVDLWIKMQNINTCHNGRLDDEWGVSDANCDQESHAYLQVISPRPGALRKGTILDYRRTGTDARWSRCPYGAGTQRWSHIYSSDAYPTNTWLLLEVGTEEWNHFWCNDVSVLSQMMMRWFLQNIYVRSSVA